MNWLKWLQSLTEIEKSAAVRPVGLSRRSFLRALGVSAVTVSMGGVVVAEVAPRWENYTFQYSSISKAELIEKMRAALPSLKFIDVTDEYQSTMALQRLFEKRLAV